VSFWRLDKQSNILTQEASYFFSYCDNDLTSPISLSPDQRYLALSNCDTEVAVFDLSTFEMVSHVNRAPRGMAWSPDSTWLALDTFQMLSLIYIPQP
jgi:hypothetical protein